jgi:DNA-binding protein YbaB
MIRHAVRRVRRISSSHATHQRPGASRPRDAAHAATESSPIRTLVYSGGSKYEHEMTDIDQRSLTYASEVDNLRDKLQNLVAAGTSSDGHVTVRYWGLGAVSHLKLSSDVVDLPGALTGIQDAINAAHRNLCEEARREVDAFDEQWAPMFLALKKKKQLQPYLPSIKRAVLQQRYERKVNQRMRKYLGAPLAPPPAEPSSEDSSESSTVELEAADGRSAGDLLSNSSSQEIPEGTSSSTSASPPLDPIAEGANEEAVPSREEPPSLAHDADIVSAAGTSPDAHHAAEVVPASINSPEPTIATSPSIAVSPPPDLKADGAGDETAPSPEDPQHLAPSSLPHDATTAPDTSLRATDVAEAPAAAAAATVDQPPPPPSSQPAAETAEEAPGPPSPSSSSADDHSHGAESHAGHSGPTPDSGHPSGSTGAP